MAIDIIGTAGDDSLAGDDRDENLIGLEGDDTLSGGLGVDSFDGGDGTDTVDFTYKSGTVVIDLPAGEIRFPGGTVETIVNVENAIGASGAGTTFIGDDNDNVFIGGFGDDPDDTFIGGGGNDFFDGRKGIDSFDGGDGIDTVTLNDSDKPIGATIDLEAGTIIFDFTQVLGPRGQQVVETIVNVENLIGPRGESIIFGSSVDNILTGNGEIYGREGNDTIFIRGGLAEGNEGDDLIISQKFAAELRGGEGNDTLIGTDSDGEKDGEEILLGGAGDDLMIGNTGIDFFDGGSGVDTVDFSYTTADADIDLDREEAIFLGRVTETVRNVENVIGTDGDNVITGSDADNVLNGAGGNDILIGGLGVDTFDGGAGSDTLDFSYTRADADIDLNTGEVTFANGVVETFANIENLIGTRGENALIGDDGDNVIEGDNKDDTLTGMGGRDTFVFRLGDDTDTITDFEDGLDRLDLRPTGLGFGDLGIFDSGIDTLIRYGDRGDEIRLANFESANLGVDDFLFV